MATKYWVQTFDDIINAVREEIGADTHDTKITTRIKRDINEVYLQEVVPEHNWSWLDRTVEIQAKAYFSTGTAAVTAGSVTVTLTESPAVSYKGFLFSSDGYNETYKIAQHTAGTATLTLESPYGGSTASAANFKIWAEALALPADCLETREIRHDFRNVPLEGLGRQEFRRLQSTAPKAQARPEVYCTGALVHPVAYESISGLPASTYRSASGLTRTIVFASTLGASESTALLAPGSRIEISGAGHYTYNCTAVVSALSTTTVTNDTITYTVEERKSESSTADSGITVKLLAPDEGHAKYRELLIYPALFDAATTLHVDYKIEPQPLVSGTDEPLIPLEDRNVLVYGALARQWVKARDEETATRNEAKFTNKLAKMAGKIGDSRDIPRIALSTQYLRGKRRRGTSGGITPPTTLGFAAGGGASEITGTASRVAIFDSNGRLASDTQISITELSYLDNVSSNIQTQLDAKATTAELTAHIDDTSDAHDASAISVSAAGNLASTDVQAALQELQGDIDTINTLADGKIYIGNASNAATEVTPSGDVTISNTGTTAIAAGAIVDADVNATAAIAHSKMAALTASRAMVTDASGFASASSVTATTLGYLDATSSIQTQLNGKQATGDYITELTGDVTASGPGSVAATIAAGAIDNAKISNTAAIADTKLDTISTAGKVSNSATTATSNNTASAIVARDGSGNFSAGTITASLTGNVTGNCTGTAANVTGTVAVANGGTNLTSYTAGDLLYATAATTLAKLAVGAAGTYLKSTGSAPSWSTIAQTFSVVSKTTTYTATSTDDAILVSASGGSWTLSLPAAADNSGKVYYIKRTDNTPANAVTVDGNGSETIDGATTRKLITQNESMTIVSDGSNWVVLSHKTATAPEAATLTITGSGANPTKGAGATDSAFWWREGAFMHIQYSYKQSAAGTAGTGTYLWAIPASQSIASSSVAYGSDDTNGVVGTAAGGGGSNVQGFVKVAGGTHLVLVLGNEATTPTAVASTAFALSNNPMRYSFIAKVPITDWWE